jgi:hypothetical protein
MSRPDMADVVMPPVPGVLEFRGLAGRESLDVEHLGQEGGLEVFLSVSPVPAMDAVGFQARFGGVLVWDVAFNGQSLGEGQMQVRILPRGMDVRQLRLEFFAESPAPDSVLDGVLS